MTMRRRSTHQGRRVSLPPALVVALLVEAAIVLAIASLLYAYGAFHV